MRDAFSEKLHDNTDNNSPLYQYEAQFMQQIREERDVSKPVLAQRYAYRPLIVASSLFSFNYFQT